MTAALLIFACIVGGVLIGMWLSVRLPSHHLSPESKDAVKMSSGLIATMTALMLGLLVASAKGRYDQAHTEVISMCAQVLELDVLLKHYGPQANNVRSKLHDLAASAGDRIWHENSTPASAQTDQLLDAVLHLSPENDAQRALLSDCRSLIKSINQTRMLLIAQRTSSISPALLIVVVAWLTIIFLSFGLFAPRNATVVAAFLICAASVTGAMFLVLEMDKPFSGMISIPREPLQRVIELLGNGHQAKN